MENDGVRPNLWRALLIVSALLALAGLVSADPIQLRFQCWDGDDNMPAIFKAAHQFELAHPGIQVKVETVTMNFQEKLMAQVAGQVAPDVVQMDPGGFQKFAVRKSMLPLNDFIKKSHYPIGDYYPNLVDAHTLNGLLYVLPRDIAPCSIVYYNKSAFDEAGIPYPDGTWTWDFKERPELKQKDFLWVVRQLRKVDPRTHRVIRWGFSPGWQDLLWQEFALSTGGRWADDYKTPRKLLYDDPKVIRAIQFSADLALKDNLIPTPTEISAEMQSSVSQLFTQGTIAMYQSGIWDIPTLRKGLPPGKPGSFDWDIAMAPAYKDGTLRFPTGGSGYAIMSQTKHPWEAWLLCSWMAGEPGMKAMAATGLAQPAIRRLALSEPWIPGPHTPADQQMPRNRIITDRSVPLVQFGPLGTEWPDANGIVTAPFTRIWDGTATAEQIIREYNPKGQERMDYLLKQRGLPEYDWRLGGLAGVLILAALGWWVYAPERKVRRTRKEKQENRVAYLFVLPWVLGVILFTAGPMILSFLMSFSDWDVIQPAKWRGLGNYAEAFTFDPRFWGSLRVTLTYTLVAVPIGVLGSLALAMLLNVKVRGIPLWRTCYYLPSVASGVAASLIWKRLFMPDGGLINTMIYGADGHGNFLGLASLLKPWATANGQANWLGSEHLALPALIMMSLWGIGGGMIILLAALQGVPAHLYEAATIDGANPWRRFRAVTVPMISPALFFSLVTGFIASFQAFTQALLMTDGGPNDSTLFFAYHLWRSGFLSLRMGYASSLAWVLFFVVLVFTVAQLKMSRWVYYEGGPV